MTVSQEAAPFVLDARFLVEQKAFADVVWPDESVQRMLDDLVREVTEEVAPCPEDVNEWADALLLTTVGAMRAGHSPQALLDAVADAFARHARRQSSASEQQDSDGEAGHAGDCADACYCGKGVCRKDRSHRDLHKCSFCEVVWLNRLEPLGARAGR